MSLEIFVINDLLDCDFGPRDPSIFIGSPIIRDPISNSLIKLFNITKISENFFSCITSYGDAIFWLTSDIDTPILFFPRSRHKIALLFGIISRITFVK